MTARPAPEVPGLTGLTVLARGGYATVYAAVQESVGRDVAVKVENRRLETERDQRRFLREARAAGRMSGHPHVVDLFDAGVTGEDHPYLIMELCESSYADRMRAAPLSPAEVIDVGVKIADALSDAHSLGVLHRDVKPANILHTRFGEPTLADFGLAILAEVRDNSVTFDVLTPAYAAPEIFRHAEPGAPGDVYALAATLYALMRGRPPRWPREGSPSLVAVMEMFGQRIPDLPGVPPDFMALLRAGMANDHASRPSALQFRDGLHALALGRSALGARPPGAAPMPAPPTRQAHPVQARPAKADPADPTRVHRASADPAPAPQRSVPADAPTILPAPMGPRPEDATVPHGRSPARRRKWWWPLGAVLAAVSTVLIIFMGNASGGLLPGSRAAPATPPRSSAPAEPCSRFLAPQARCPGGHECYGELSPTGTATRVDCTRPHTWEVFAVGELPPGERRTDYRSVHDNAAVRDVCAHPGLVTLVPLEELTSWEIDVMPPRGGDDRTYRCLARKGSVQLTSPTLGEYTGASTTPSAEVRPSTGR